MRRRPRAVGPLPGSYPALHGARPACRRRGSGGLRAPRARLRWAVAGKRRGNTRQLRPCCHRQGVCRRRGIGHLNNHAGTEPDASPRPVCQRHVQGHRDHWRARARMPQSRRSDATERHPPAPVPIAPIRAPPGSQPTAQAAQARRLSEMPPDPPGSQRPGAGRPGARETRSVLQGDRPSCLPARGVGAYEPRFPYELF